MKKLALAIFLLLVIPLATALDCNDLQHQDLCEEIVNSDITEEEKLYLLGDIFSDTKYRPDHNFVREWNDGVDLATAPNDVTTTSSGYITNAWVDILAVMPSVSYNDTLYVSTDGEVLTAYAHDVNMPSGTEQGDCKTKYSLHSNSATNTVYINGHYVNVGTNAVYTVQLDDTDPVSIDARYVISVTIKVKHYDYSYLGDCIYDNTEYRSSNLVLTDTVDAVISNPELNASLSITKQYYDTSKAELITTDFVNTRLEIGDGRYYQHNYIFSEEVTKFPLDVLVVKAEDYFETETVDVVASGNELTFSETFECVIYLDSFFGNTELLCDLEYTENVFTVTTDRFAYDENETIELIINPLGNYLVEYAGQDYQTSSGLELLAVHGANKITVNDELSKYVHVKDGHSFAYLTALTFFGLFNGIMVVLAKKYGGAFL